MDAADAAEYHSKDEAPPLKPPRPLSPREQAENTLKEAFPSIDAAVVKAVLTASGGQVEPAFNALLGMSDPDSQKDVEPPAKPPRPTQQYGIGTTTAQSQLEADEMYARQLAEHYSGGSRQQQQRESSQGWNQQSQRPKQPGRAGSKGSENERSFIDGWSDHAVNRSIIDALPLDELPVIKENIRKGFLETQSTVNKWIGNLRKKLDGEDESDFNSQPARPAQAYQPGHPSYGRRSGEMGRRSADRDRYDADPELIDDDFSRLELRDAENTPARPSNRPLANPDLFKPTPPPLAGRKVSFQGGPPEEIPDMYSASPPPSARPTTSNKSSKWQPLKAVDPSPVSPMRDEHDPFSVGDSDEDRDTKLKEAKGDEADRLQKATSEAMAEDIGTGKSVSESESKT
jgi:CUE domain